ncbi:hypothetical protein ABVK25_010595 [Lepraria finkii]|uniref:F-box domain-containing protein n=1 Tax=Lepraria finkii TaxID=1340010 RepID=A0ABR4AUA5_9LECA
MALAGDRDPDPAQKPSTTATESGQPRPAPTITWTIKISARNTGRSQRIEPRKGFYGSFEHATDSSREENGFIPVDIRQLAISRLAPRPPFFISFTDVVRRLRGGFQLLPPELKFPVYKKLDPAAKINLTLACHRFSDRDIEWMTHEEV